MKHPTSNIEHPTSKRTALTVLRSMCGFHVLCALLFFVLLPVSARAQVSREYQIKAAFLYNFAQFTDWPPAAFESTNSPIVIGILGTDPFGRALQQTIDDESVRGHKLVIDHYRRAEEIKTCHILFISQSETRRVDEIVKSLSGKPVLTVADMESPSSAGIIIRFTLENNKVHFRINQEAARAANVALSSKLLRVADAAPPGRAP